jgi:hypothetical protein
MSDDVKRQTVLHHGAPALGLLLAMAASGAMLGGAAAHDLAKYPEMRAQWTRIGSASFDPNKPGGRGQQPPLTSDYQALWEAGVADQTAGGHGNNPTPTCLPPGMPRAMIVYEPMEIVITPAMTFVSIEYMGQLRRIHTDGRDWPARIAPSFLGTSIGRWEDTDGDGAYDTLAVETRGMRGPRTFDGNIPLHKDNQTVVKERIVFDRSGAGTLRNEVTTIDNALTRPWTVMRGYRRTPSPVWFEYPCGENNQHVFIGKENYLLSADGFLMPARKDQPPPDLRRFDEPPQR